MKLTVGDIQMDSERGVSFGTAAAPVEHVELLTSIAQAPRWSFAVGAIGATLAAIILAAGGVWLQWWWCLVPAALFGRLGLYGYFLAFAPRVTAPTRISPMQLERILTALQGRTLSLASVAAAAGDAERDVLRGLLHLIERGEVDEDLDVETGRWVYRRTALLAHQPHHETLCAADRLRAIENQQPENVH